MNFELLKTLTILYIEDEISLQEDICQNIAPFVKEIIRGNDGDEGLNLFMANRDRIDLIISDILMPKLNGMICQPYIILINQISKQLFHFVTPFYFHTQQAINYYLYYAFSLDYKIPQYIQKYSD